MNMLGPTAILYVVVGACVATAVYLSPVGGGRVNVFLAIPFWPLYLPLLLARPGLAGTPRLDSLPTDKMTAAIRQVDAELSGVLSTMDGWGVTTRADEKERLAMLLAAWISQAERIREMDRLLALPEYLTGVDEPICERNESAESTDRVRESRRSRQENVDRLRQVRLETFDDLMARLARVRELVSMIHLARFTDGPASRARELLAQIAGSGDIGLCNPQLPDLESGIRTGK